MNIVISNDDGIGSEGLRVLAETLAAKHSVLVVAPDAERSAASHSLTIGRPMLKKIARMGRNIQAYALAGTPADCVKFALTHFADFHPDAVVSGINFGPNLGLDVMYSGTVSCAREAAAMGVCGVAVSCAAYKDFLFQPAADFIAGKLEFFRSTCLKDGFYNVNVPNLAAEQIKGYRFVRMGQQVYDTRYEESEPDMFTLLGTEAEAVQPDTDLEAVRRGFIAVTPLLVDATDYGLLAKLNGEPQ